MSLFTGNHVEKNRMCCDSIRCCTIATMDYGTDPISSFLRSKQMQTHFPYTLLSFNKKSVMKANPFFGYQKHIALGF